MFIEDGTGSGKLAAVTDDNRMLVVSQSFDSVGHATFQSLGFTYSTPIITLTTASESGIIYIKNTNIIQNLFVSNFLISLGKSTGGTPGDTTIRVYQNPTGGTLISGTALTAMSRNFGSTVPAQSTSTSGAEGNTITGGTVFAINTAPDLSFQQIATSLVVPNGNAIAMSIQPPASNTSQKVIIAIVCAFIDPASI